MPFNFQSTLLVIGQPKKKKQKKKDKDNSNNYKINKSRAGTGHETRISSRRCSFERHFAHILLVPCLKYFSFVVYVSAAAVLSADWEQTPYLSAFFAEAKLARVLQTIWRELAVLSKAAAGALQIAVNVTVQTHTLELNSYFSQHVDLQSAFSLSRLVWTLSRFVQKGRGRLWPFRLHVLCSETTFLLSDVHLIFPCRLHRESIEADAAIGLSLTVQCIKTNISCLLLNVLGIKMNTIPVHVF